MLTDTPISVCFVHIADVQPGLLLTEARTLNVVGVLGAVRVTRAMPSDSVTTSLVSSAASLGALSDP